VLDGLTIADGHAQAEDRSSFAEPNTPFVISGERNQGGGINVTEKGSLTLRNCLFRDNTSLSGGGAIAIRSSGCIEVQGCTFDRNESIRQGGAIQGHSGPVDLILIDCYFHGNASQYGAHAVWLLGGRMEVSRSRFHQNGPTYLANPSSNSTFFNQGATILLTNCLFSGNRDTLIETFHGKLDLSNCTMVGNEAITSSQGTAIRSNGSYLTITNSIIWGNTHTPDPLNHTWYQVTHGGTDGKFEIVHSLIESWRDSSTGHSGVRHPQQPGPFFVDADGPDNHFGNTDDDLRLLPGSRGIDEGWNYPEPTLPDTDLDGRPRIINKTVDMGAYEFAGIVYVDSEASQTQFRSPGNGTAALPFPDIDIALQFTREGQIIEVAPGFYTAPFAPGDQSTAPWLIDKNITLRSQYPTDPLVANRTILSGPIVFRGDEDANCLLTGFRIEHAEQGAVYGNHTQATLSYCYLVGNGPCDGAVLVEFDGLVQNCLIADTLSTGNCGLLPVVYNCSATFRNCTIANNPSGVSVYRAFFENSILYHNDDPNIYLLDRGELTLFDNTVELSDGIDEHRGSSSIVQLGTGTKIVSKNTRNDDPMFVRHGTWNDRTRLYQFGDYHLRSEGWRWSDDLDHGFHWIFDNATSPCIDAGNPSSDLGEELYTVPHDPDGEYGINRGVINQGAYGGTYQASLAPPSSGGR
jgi:hypothetical protein